MHLQRKWAVARAVVTDNDEDIMWIAETRAKSGTWVIREVGDGSADLVGAQYSWEDNFEDGRLLTMTAEQREEIGMSSVVYERLDLALRDSYRKAEAVEAARVKLWSHKADRETLLACRYGEGDHVVPALLAWLGGPSGAEDIIEGVTFEHYGVTYRRTGSTWVAVGDSEKELDAAFLASIGK